MKLYMLNLVDIKLNILKNYFSSSSKMAALCGQFCSKLSLWSSEVPILMFVKSS